MDLDQTSTRVPTPGRLAERRHPVRHLAGFGMAGGALLLGLVWATSGTLGAAVLGALGFYGAALGLAGWAFWTHYPHARLGLCNLATLFRLVLTSALLAILILGEPPSVGLFGMALIAFTLDGVDGWLARREGLSSEVGARFDMEVDSAFALILAALAVQTGLNPLVILLGLPRYIFGLARLALPVLNGPLNERFSRKMVCVLQIAALIFLVVPWIEPGTRHTIAGLAGGLVIWSFALDIHALWRAQQ